MTIETDKLIESLAGELDPMRPLGRPARRAMGWLLGGIIYFAILASVVSGFDFESAGGNTAYLLSQLLAIAAGATAAIAAFVSVVPGHSRRFLGWAILATALWLAVLIYSAADSPRSTGILAARDEWACVGMILLGGSPLLVALAVMLRRGAPLNPWLTAVLGALAVGLLANVAACIARPHSADTVMLAWHLGTIFALALSCIVGARHVLVWRSRGARTRSQT